MKPFFSTETTATTSKDDHSVAHDTNDNNRSSSGGSDDDSDSSEVERARADTRKNVGSYAELRKRGYEPEVKSEAIVGNLGDVFWPPSKVRLPAVDKSYATLMLHPFQDAT